MLVHKHHTVSLLSVCLEVDCLQLFYYSRLHLDRDTGVAYGAFYMRISCVEHILPQIHIHDLVITAVP